MTTPETTDANMTEARKESGPQLVRISDHIKMRPCVAFALNFLENNEDRPLVFHTLPATPAPVKAVDGDGQAKSSKNNNNPVGSKASVTKAVPRLISIVEIIKREFIKSLGAKHSTRLSGLHQYNQLGCLEDLDGVVDGVAVTGEDRANELEMALNGKNHVRQKQTPYMKITLSLSPLPELVEQGATYQPPTIRKLSKSAKVRAKKRERRAKHSKDEPLNMNDNS